MHFQRKRNNLCTSAAPPSFPFQLHPSPPPAIAPIVDAAATGVEREIETEARIFD